jgi:hypothetical protein
MQSLTLMCRLPRRAIDFLAVTDVVCRKNVYVIPSVGPVSLALNLFGRDRGHFVTCNRLFRVAVRLRGSRPSTNCTWVSFRYRKGSEDYTPVCGVCRLAQLSLMRGGPRRLGGSDDVMSNNGFSLGKSPSCGPVGMEQIADLPPKCSNPARWKPGTLCE